MTQGCQWSPDLEIGVAEIDAQHKNLCTIVNRLHSARSPDALRRELMNIYRHTREHFQAEERLMRRVGYPQLAEHRRQHDEMLQALTRRSETVLHEPAHRDAFIGFMHRWIGEHVAEHDQKIAAYLQAPGGDVVAFD